MFFLQNGNNLNHFLQDDQNLNQFLQGEQNLNFAQLFNPTPTNTIHQRQNTATTTTTTAANAANAYLDLSVQNTTDTQNVHDTSVLAGFKNIVDRLNNDFEGELQSIADIESEIKLHGKRFSENRPQLTIDALAVIEKIKQKEKIVSLNLTDLECLQLVWHRANHKKNINNCNKIKQSIFDNLVDCWEVDEIGGLLNNMFGIEETTQRKIVCVTGRVTRILSSLILLDFDPKNWEVKRFEQFKNDIFNKTKLIIEEEATKAMASSDIEMQNAGKTFLAKTTIELSAIKPPSIEAEKQLITNIKENIEKMITTHIDIEGIPPNMITSVKKEALASIDLF